MLLKSIELSKSKTVGFITSDNRTKFKKITITATADIDKTDDPNKSYHKLSQFIEKQFLYESKN